MNLLKKLNTYLLENHPLTWHSKVIQLTLAGVLFWILSYYVGYALIDIHILQQDNYTEYYAESSFIWFHVIYIVVILSIWAFYFYRNNAFRSLYPVNKTYFFRLFLQLFIPFLILISAYTPFTKGCKDKTATFFDEKTINSDVDKLNLGNVFLISNASSYEIENRVYPKPYPLKHITYNQNQGYWGHRYADSSHLIFQEYKKKYWNGDESDPRFTAQLNGKKMQFYKSHEVYLDKHKCESKKHIDKIYPINELDKPESHSVLNFSSELICIEPTEFMLFHFENDNGSQSKLYENKYAPIIHSWIRNKKYKNVENAIQNFKEICTKYKIDHRINTTHILQYLKYKKFKDLHHPIVHYGWEELYDQNITHVSLLWIICGIILC